MQIRKRGFTLAELLIALALLGVIAAFTIPKILNATNSAQMIANVKDGVSTIEQAWYNIQVQGQVCTAGNCTANGNNSGTATLYDELINNPNSTSTINYAAASQQGSPPGGCGGNGTGLGVPLDTANDGFTQGYIQLANGVIISGLYGSTQFGLTPYSSLPSNYTSVLPANPDNPPGSPTPQYNYIICIDANGAAGPNQLGSDVFFINFNYSGAFTINTPGNPNGADFFTGNCNQPTWATNAQSANWAGWGTAPIGFAAAGCALSQ